MMWRAEACLRSGEERGLSLEAGTRRGVDKARSKKGWRLSPKNARPARRRESGGKPSALQKTREAAGIFPRAKFSPCATLGRSPEGLTASAASTFPPIVHSMRFSHIISVTAALAALALAPVAPAQKAVRKKAPEPTEPQVPEDLLQDEHVREEFGVNDFTAPSIKKLFGDLAKLGPLPYEKLRRDLPKDTPKDRAQVALSLGMLIADGFLMVTTEKISEFEDVGRGVLKHAKVLGAGDRISRHTKTIIENSVGGDWDTLKDELSRTQVDVEAEMVLLRDQEIAHLISLGGWIRGLQISATAALEPFTPEKAKTLARPDLIEYFQYGLEDLPAKIRDQDPVAAVRASLATFHDILNKPEGAALTEADVQRLRDQAGVLVKLIESPKKK